MHPRRLRLFYRRRRPNRYYCQLDRHRHRYLRPMCQVLLRRCLKRRHHRRQNRRLILRYRLGHRHRRQL
jgi:hypothetical protein